MKFDTLEPSKKYIYVFILLLVLTASLGNITIKNVAASARGDDMVIGIIVGFCALAISESFWTAVTVVLIVLAVLPYITKDVENKFSIIKFLKNWTTEQQRELENEKNEEAEAVWESRKAFGIPHGSLSSISGKTKGGRPGTYQNGEKSVNRLIAKDRTVRNTLGTWYPEIYQDKKLGYSQKDCASGLATSAGCIDMGNPMDTVSPTNWNRYQSFSTIDRNLDISPHIV